MRASIAAGEDYVIDFRSVSPTGDVLHLSCMAEVETDRAGESIRVWGTTQDDLQALISSGADVNAQDPDGQSALMMAAPRSEPARSFETIGNSLVVTRCCASSAGTQARRRRLRNKPEGFWDGGAGKIPQLFPFISPYPLASFAVCPSAWKTERARKLCCAQ